MKKKVYEVWAEGIFYGSHETKNGAVQLARMLHSGSPELLFEIREGKA